MDKPVILHLFRKIFWKFGYEIREKEVTPLKTNSNDPREIPYLQDLPYALQDLPTNLGVGLKFYRLDGKTYHPFVLALRKAGLNKNGEEFAFEVLKKYNQLCYLKTANDVLGLSKEERCFSESNHPFEYTYPWSTISPQDLKKDILRDIHQENKRYGFNALDSLDLPFASDEKIRIETKRLISLSNTITENGFKTRYFDSLGCFILTDGNTWRWFIHGGQHRAAVLASMGYDRIPVHVRRIIRREDVNYWPNVQSGIFTEAQALLVFDKLFNVQHPPTAGKWVEYVDKMFYAPDSLSVVSN